MTDKVDISYRLMKQFAQLSLKTEMPFELMLPCGWIKGDAMICGFEHEIGVVIVSNLNQLGGLSQHLPQFGYGYHLIAGRDELLTMQNNDWKELLCTWRWTADGAPPAWYHYDR